MQAASKLPKISTCLLFLTPLLFVTSCYTNIDAKFVLAPRPACLISRFTTWTGDNYGPKTESEQLTINGKSHTIYKDNDRSFTYDEKGRLIRESKNERKSSSDISYTYTVTKLFIRHNIIDNVIFLQTYSNTIPLNSRGYNDRYSYTEQGQQLKRKSFQTDSVDVEMGNLRYYYSYIIEGLVRIQDAFLYDTNRPSMPQIAQYSGIGDKNLLLSITTNIIENRGAGPFLKKGTVYRIDCYYEFDINNRVKRAIYIDTEYPGSGWYFHVNSGGISVVDYEYSCR